MKFYVGLDRPGQAQHFDRAFISVNRIRRRRAPILNARWIMDSGAFTELSTHGHYRHDVGEYATIINRWTYAGSGLVAVVSQDFMCEPVILERTGLTIADHQRLTIERFDALRMLVSGAYVMPVLQGYSVCDYARHVDQYGNRLHPRAYVGVGSLCKRNSNIATIENILITIKRKRPGFRLHGFGLKSTALRSALVWDSLESADSMAWSFSARRQGRDRHSWQEAKRWLQRLEKQAVQTAWDWI